METILMEETQQVLSTFPEYWEEETLLKNKVIDDLRGYRSELIEKLLKNEIIKQAYSMQVGDTTIFKIQDFISMMRYKNYWENSYTKYNNEIGLTSEGKYLKYNTDVVLDFPHKDCVLEGGMTKEDIGKNEVFYHNVLAKEEIDLMLSPKVLTSVKRYDKNGEQEVTKFNDTDNLIIKGNNLIALHTLKKRFAGKVKLIYIDPPYNTKNDSFKYNDKFSRSTWLTFMKNRLEVAKELLADNGVIFVQIDYNEAHYLKILMDDIFGESNFRNEIIWRRKQATSFGKSKFGITNDTLFFYSRSDNYDFYPVYSLEDDNTQKYIKERFKFDDGDGRKYMKSPLVNSLYRPNLKYVFKGINPPENGWLYSEKKMNEMYENGEIIVPDDPNARLYRKIYLDDYQGQVVQNIWLDIPIVNPMAKEQVDFQTQKPEKLLERIISCSTKPGELVLDFCLGSGTTAATAHKMGRQYIGIEQMEYVKKVTIERLTKVVEGDTSGISKTVGWDGGGSFVYAELYELNQKFVHTILETESEEELFNLIDEIKNKAFLDFKIDIEKLSHDEEGFSRLTLEKKKDVLIKSLDANQMYLSYSEIDDTEYGIPDSVKQFNYSFYNVGEQL